jgi:hypothetical protein
MSAILGHAVLIGHATAPATHQRGGAADHLALSVVLRAVARALELVLSLHSIMRVTSAAAKAHYVRRVPAQPRAAHQHWPSSRTHPDPRHHAAQVSAHGVQAELLNGVVLGHNQVGGVALRERGAADSPVSGGQLEHVAAAQWGPCEAPIPSQRPAGYLQALRQRAIAGLVGLEPGILGDVVAERVLGRLATTAATSAARVTSRGQGLSKRRGRALWR